jgi:glycine cleavage system H protein
MMEIPEGLRYTRDHEWARADGNEIVVGVTDYAQDQLGDVVYVELPAVGASVASGDPFGSIEAVKAVADLNSPLTGEVVAVNAELADDPALINRSCYGDGWMIRVKPGNLDELNELMDAVAYRKMVAAL